MPRRRSLLIGTVAAVVAFGAAIGAGAVVQSLEDDPPGDREPEVELTFDESDDESGADDLIGGDVEGELAPDQSFALLAGGSMSLADLRGTPVVVNFFASWCTPCVKEMPDFETVHQELGDTVAFVGINLRDSTSAATEIVEETGVTYTIGRDPSGDLFQSFDAVNMPSTFFIAADGTVVDSHAGAMDADDLRDRIQSKLLG